MRLTWENSDKLAMSCLKHMRVAQSTYQFGIFYGTKKIMGFGKSGELRNFMWNWQICYRK